MPHHVSITLAQPANQRRYEDDLNVSRNMGTVIAMCVLAAIVIFAISKLREKSRK